MHVAANIVRHASFFKTPIENYSNWKTFYQPNRDIVTNSVAAIDATNDTTVICVLIEGPAVSLKGSPTVSPMTAAL